MLANTHKLMHPRHTTHNGPVFYLNVSSNLGITRKNGVIAYLTIMRKLLTDAEAAWASSRGDDGSLDEIRKVVAVGIACMEQHGAVIRDPQTFVSLAAKTGKYSHSVNGE